MKVERVCANIRYSKALGDGQHKTVELTAEGSVEARETWQVAQSYLYTELGKQLRELWPSNGNGAGTKQAIPGAESHTQPPNTPTPAATTREHYCPVHEVAFTERQKDGEAWHSHKIKGTSEWCTEAKTEGR